MELFHIFWKDLGLMAVIYKMLSNEITGSRQRLQGARRRKNSEQMMLWMFIMLAVVSLVLSYLLFRKKELEF